MPPSTRKSVILLLMLWGCVSGQNYLGAPQASSAWQQQQQQPQPQSPPLYQPYQSGQQQQSGGLSGYPSPQHQQHAGGSSGYMQQSSPQLYGSRSQLQHAAQHGQGHGQGPQGAPGLLGSSRQTYPPNETRDTGLTVSTTTAHPGFLNGASGASGAYPAGVPGVAATDQNVLQLEPHGSVNQADPNSPDSQVFKAGDQALYAVDWSYPRSRHAPNSIVLKRWGGQSPPEYVAVYRLRGPAPESPPSYSLAHDELRHYPWDAARRFQGPRWRTAPRDEDFELIPAGTGLHGSNSLGQGSHSLGHGSNGLGHGSQGSLPSQQQYMFRTL